MARLARIIVPGVPHHVTQRGNRREPIFFEDGDQALYRHILAEQADRHGVQVWAYCLMPNHVHLILVPATAEGLARAMGEAHRRYASFINARARWVGHLFQGRYASVPMDETHLIAAVRYVSLNPVRAGLVRAAEDWAWSSARAHLQGLDDRLVRVGPVLDRVARFADLIDRDVGTDGPYGDAVRTLREAEATGRPVGSAAFVADLERRLGRSLARPARGRPSKTA